MESYVECVLKVRIHCEACRMKLLELLRSISGVYSITIDAEKGLAKISGEVDPNILLKAIARSTGKHAEVKWVNLNRPPPSYGGGGSYNYNDGHYYGYNYDYNPYSYGPINEPFYGIRGRALMADEGIWYPQTWPATDYRHHQPPYYGSNYGYLPSGGALYNWSSY